MSSKQNNCHNGNQSKSVNVIAEDLPMIIFTMDTANFKDKQPNQTNENTHRKSISTRWMSASMMLYLVLTMHIATVATALGHEMAASQAPKYSQPLTTVSGGIVEDENDFRPIVPNHLSPEYISSSVFTKSGHYRIFQPVESDLRMAAAMTRKDYHINSRASTNGKLTETATETTSTVLKSTTMSASVNTKLLMNDTQLVSTDTQAELGVDNEMPQEHVAIDAELNEVPRLNETDDNDDDDDNGDDDDDDVDDVVDNEEKMDDEVDELNETRSGAAQTSGDNSGAMQQELKGLEELLIDYVENLFSKGQYQPLPGLIIELQKNHKQNHSSTDDNDDNASNDLKRSVRQAVENVMEDGNINVDVPRALQTGRLLFFSGLKKIMWPLYMGLQVLKSLMFALFLPTIIGSVSRLIGKGITSGSAGSAPLFIRPMEAPQDLDFKDNNFSFDDDTKFVMNDDGAKNSATAGYEYNQAEASQTQAQYAPYNAGTINQQALSRYGMNERQQLMQDTYLSALQSIGSASFKNSQGISSGLSGALAGGGVAKKPPAPANMNTFQTFQKVPTSSLLLSNYDPFYSPLLSRLDSVFAQFKLNSDNEICREKLICLMYANPTKYAPYSNLVSAQLSRELNELRKPTSDNPEILRFFKYMRAAKDGQDGIDCEQSFEKCKEFKDSENPAMLATYNDINKLVQARKLT